jgi:F-type H+-transporting ATPase subunit beta
MSVTRPSTGTIEAVRGSVVDACFPQRIPPMFNNLKAGNEGKVAIEVVSHLDARTVRGIAVSSTWRLSRGSPVMDTEQPLKVPVGERVLGRMFNVFGETIDRKDPMEGGECKAHETFEGNRQDRTTVGEMLDQLEKRTGRKAGSTVAVDRGMAYQEDWEQIRAQSLNLGRGQREKKHR